MRFRTVVSSALITLCAVVAAQAQEDLYSLPPMNLDFPGGTVGEYVKAIRKASERANVVVMPEVEAVPLGRVNLQRADLLASLLFLDGYESKTASCQTALHVLIEPARGEGDDVIVIRGEVRDLVKERPATSTVVSVEDLIGAGTPVTAEDVLGAVEAALELTVGIYPQATISFHEPTGLIIARGHPEQMNAIESVVDQLRIGVRMRQQEQQQAGKAEYEAEIQQLQMSIKQMDYERNLLMTRSEQRIAELEARLSERERQIIVLQEEIEKLKK